MAHKYGATPGVRELAVEPGQAAMYYLWQLDPGASSYAIHLTVRAVSPDSDTEGALVDAFERVRAAHPALCARFAAGEGGLVQRIERDRGLEVRRHACDSTEAAAQTLREALAVPLDLTDGVCRLDLCRVGSISAPQAVYAAFVVHHIVADGVALDRLLGDLEQGADAAGFAAEYEHYMQLVQRRRGYPSTPAYERDRAFWADHLKEVTDLDLPLDRPRPPRQTFNGECMAFELDPQNSAALLAHAEVPGQSLLAVLMAAHATALHGFTGGQRDFAIGTTFHNRSQADASVVANLSNTLPVPAAVAPERGFAEYARELRRRLMRIARHRRLFTAHLPRSGARVDRAPLFQTHVLLQNAEIVRRVLGEEALVLPGVASPLHFVDQRPQEGQFELALEALHTGDRLAFTLKYNRDLFRPETAQAFAAALLGILSQVAADPDCNVGALAAGAEPPPAPRRDHVGYAVPDIEGALAMWGASQRLATIEGPLHDPLQRVDLCMVTTSAGDRIELVAGEGVQGLMARGPGPYHSCYEVTDLDAEITARRRAGQTLIAAPRPAPLFDQRRVAFLSTPLGLEELLEAPASPAQRIVVSADFTAAPLQERLATWARALGWRRRVEVADSTQIIEALLADDRALARERGEINLVLATTDPSWSRATCRTYAGELLQAAGAFTGRHEAAIALLLCPVPGAPTPTWPEDLPASPDVVALALHRFLPVPDRMEALMDPQAYRIGRVPYAPAGLDHVALALARVVHALDKPPHKVIVTDCDETLWGGVVGEEGPEGVRVEARHRALQAFLREQKAQGVLLALASKNAVTDVAEVFAKHPEMLLERDDFVAEKINWRSKPENLRALAAELDLGLDSFVFIDDSPVECAQMRAQCPAATVIHLAPELDVAGYLHRAWAFDMPRSTAAAADRTALYRTAARREAARSEAPSLVAYIEGLELEITLAPPREAELSRAVELTHRTNQFNLNGRPASAAALRDPSVAGRRVRLVAVRDRFGDYGITGLVALDVDGQGVAHVWQFLLSCRVLNRGVEHRLLQETGRIAAAAGAHELAFDAVDTGRNAPLQDFVCRLGVQPTAGARLSVEAALALDWREALKAPANPETSQPGEDGATTWRPPGQAHGPGAASPAVAPEVLEWIAVTLCQDQALSRFYRPHAPENSAEPTSHPDTDDGVPARLYRLAAQALGMERVDPERSFVELGGDSLAAVGFLASVGHTFGVEIGLLELFEAGNLHGLARRIQGRCLQTVHVLREPTGALEWQVVFAYPAGGDGSCYRSLVEELPSDCRAIAVNPDPKDQAVTLEELAEAGLARAAGLIDPAKPLVFAGWSMGAALAQIMASSWLKTSMSDVRLLMVDPIRPPRAPGPEAVAELVDTLLERLPGGVPEPTTGRDALERRVGRELGLLAAFHPAPLSIEAAVVFAERSFPSPEWDSEPLWREVLPSSTFARVDGDHVSVVTHPEVARALRGLRPDVPHVAD